MVAGPGADAFVLSEGLDIEEPDYFFSEVRWRSLEAFISARGGIPPDRPVKTLDASAADPLVHDEGKQGTVGAVAVDRFGHVAAATSTGGVTGKRWGRVGDSPIIGAGCYASDASCAVSCTGSGEHFIRLVLAHRVASKVEFGGLTLATALRSVIGDLSAIGGSGGAIAVSPFGDLAWGFNTAGMYRAFARADGPIEVKIFADDLEAAPLKRQPSD
jgi:beta-aspartyl-peptidase (threonine type)